MVVVRDEILHAGNIVRLSTSKPHRAAGRDKIKYVGKRVSRIASRCEQSHPKATKSFATFILLFERDTCPYLAPYMNAPSSIKAPREDD